MTVFIARSIADELCDFRQVREPLQTCFLRHKMGVTEGHNIVIKRVK